MSVETSIVGRRPLVVALLSIAAFAGLYGQEDDAARWYLSGYVKQLQNFNFFNASFPAPPTFTGTDTLLLDQFFHQRFNLEWSKGEHWRVQSGIRTRLFYGDVVKSNPLYGEQISAGSNDWIDLDECARRGVDPLRRL